MRPFVSPEGVHGFSWAAGPWLRRRDRGRGTLGSLGEGAERTPRAETSLDRRAREHLVWLDIRRCDHSKLRLFGACTWNGDEQSAHASGAQARRLIGHATSGGFDNGTHEFQVVQSVPA